MEGIIIVNKPQGLTSMDVIRRLRRILKIKKMGHSGTLDPIATGVLPVFLGRAATKNISKYMEGRKGYLAEMVLGVETDTLDAEGKIISINQLNNHLINNEVINNVLNEFMGEIEQVPPMYSAVHHEGRRLYELAREGRVVERKSRKVVIYRLESRNWVKGVDAGQDARILSQESESSLKGPASSFLTSFPNQNQASLYIECSKGTYIRQLISDIGKRLGCGAHMSALQRTFSEPFDISQAHTLEEIEKIAGDGKIEELIIPVSS